jgi:hypothetical protein
MDADDAGFALVACSEEHLNHRISQVGWRRSQHGQAGTSQLPSAGGAAAGPGTHGPDIIIAGEAAVSADEAAVNHSLLPAPPVLPPPYLDPPTWSSSSLENLVQFASISIHSSLGIGESLKDTETVDNGVMKTLILSVRLKTCTC